MYFSDKRNTTHENPQAGPARSDDHDDDRLLYRRISPYIPARLIPGWNKNFFLNVVDAPYIQERLVVQKLRYIFVEVKLKLIQKFLKIFYSILNNNNEQQQQKLNKHINF